MIAIVFLIANQYKLSDLTTSFNCQFTLHFRRKVQHKDNNTLFNKRNIKGSFFALQT